MKNALQTKSQIIYLNNNKKRRRRNTINLISTRHTQRSIIYDEMKCTPTKYTN